MPDKIFTYWSDNEDTEGWHSIFVERTQPSLEREWAWCPATFTNRSTPDGLCLDCGQPVRKVQNDLIRPHLTQETPPGIYLVDVGSYSKSPGPRRLKIGMSQAPVTGRLENHLQNPDHERCVVHYCFPVPSDDHLTWQIPQILEALLHAHLPQAGAESVAYEYFTWSDELLERCVAYLNRPGLVEEIRRWVE